MESEAAFSSADTASLGVQDSQEKIEESTIQRSIEYNWEIETETGVKTVEQLPRRGSLKQAAVVVAHRMKRALNQLLQRK